MNDSSRWKRIILVLAAVAATLSGCQGGGEDPLDAFSSTATVERGTIADVVRMAGQVVAVNSRQLTMGTIGGRVSEVLVHPGQEVQQGQALVRLDTLELERELREVEADLEVAEAVLAEAEREAGEIELAEAEADLTYAEYELAAAKMELALAEQAGLLLLEEAVADAEVALQVARDQLRMKEIGTNRSTIRSLEYDQGFYQRTLRDLPTDDGSRGEIEKRLGETERDLGRARAAREDVLRAGREEVEKKEEVLVRARTSLVRAQSGEEDPTSATRLAHRQAQADFEKAEQRVEDLRAGGESEALRAAKAAHEAALAEVESAKADLAAATLHAPIDGIVLALYVQDDDRVQPSDNLMYLADLDELHVQAEVTEMDVPHLAVGQYVRITFDAYPGQLFSGEVLSLPLRGRGQGGLSFYQVETSLAREGADIRLGMLANVRVVIGERYNVLTVPAAALVYRTPEEIVVKVRSADGDTREQRVEIGLSDGILAEVLSGLSEGQTVLVPLVPPQDQFGPVGPFR